MRKNTLVLFLLTYSISSFAQKLTKSEVIEVLTKNSHSEKVISKVLELNSDFQEIEQINLLEKKGFSDDIIIEILNNHTKISEQNIGEILDYQAKGYSNDLILKYILSLPKFSKLKSPLEHHAEFGINAGLQNAYFNNYTEMTNITQTSGNFRIIFGGNVQYNFSKNCWFSSSLNFEQKGTRVHPPDNPKHIANIFIPYLSLPVSLNLGVGNNTKFYFSFGGYGSFAIKKPTYIYNGVTYTEMELNTNTPIDFGSIIGLGFKMKQKEYANIFMEVRYAKGFRDVKLNDIFVRNSNLGLVFGITFNKRRSKVGK